MDLLGRIRGFAERHNLWQPGTRVVSALSGGADSVALLLLLRDLHEQGDLVLVAAAHLNHAIRGQASDDDEAFCRALCDRIHLPLVTLRVDVPALAAHERVSLEIAARRARHQLFQTIVAEHHGVIATAHTEDDQAETVLLRLVRGAGGRGLGGIRPRRDHLIRPLLGVRRAELREFLGHRGQAWREDHTNADVANPRNRVRHELLPYLARNFNPSVTQALARLADVSGTDEAWIEQLVDAYANTAIRPTADNDVSVNVSALAGVPRALGRRMARRALETANPARSYSVEDVDQVLAIAAGHPTAAEISGLRVERFRDSAVLIKRVHAARPRRRGVGL